MKRLAISLALSLIAVLVIAAVAAAHKPVIVEKQPTVIKDPEFSRAFYSELPGKPRIYTIKSPTGFNLYINLLVPKSSNPDGRYSANIYRVKNSKNTLISTLDGNKGKWTKFYEEFAGDTYLKGPEFKKHLPAGRYKIKVFSADNQGKYVLAVGEREEFGPKDAISVFTILPELKLHFFGVSPLTLFLAIMGAILAIGVILAVLVSLIIWKYIRLLVGKLVVESAKKRLAKNMSGLDQIARLIIGLALVLLAVHFWNIPLFVLASFFLYEAASGWSVLYAIIGRQASPSR